MGKFVSSNKREVEKKKQSKRLEKQKRKEERKNNTKGSSFEDMIAFVDENGNITSTPPDPSKREEVDADNIEISIPKKEEVEEVPLEGKVEYFSSEKGYGFIKDSGSAEKYFFHISNAPDSIKEGDTVNFELERGKRGLNAVNVTYTDAK